MDSSQFKELMRLLQQEFRATREAIVTAIKSKQFPEARCQHVNKNSAGNCCRDCGAYL
jgi:hypothetical protein